MVLFDNRYEYDQIYPRGRSGETLRAVDTQDNNRPLVIKRPAPQDAPPLRAAQEVSIKNEKKALERLSGHLVLTELRGSGTFRAGGSSYLYIAMDRAEGETVEQIILAGQRPPELEMLVILDRLLDLLMAAHAQHVIYNDVDAKHLFWDREKYRLKVIDWGNAVLIDEAGHQPGITAAVDIYQVGELINFIYQGGTRLSGESTPEGDYHVNFSGEVPPAIQDIITRATHPNIKNKRFPTLRALRESLSSYRQPIERGRDQMVNGVEGRLVENASQQLLQDLLAELAPALALDPGFPQARRLDAEIRRRLQYLRVQADFDATRIYLETGNWARAIRLMEDLIPAADPHTATSLTFLVAAAEQFQASGHAHPPDGFGEVIDAVLLDKIPQAARLLMAFDAPAYQHDLLLIAERLVVSFPGIKLLRPHLARLVENLGKDRAESVRAAEARLNAPLDPGITPLADRYGKLAIQMADLGAEHAEDAAYEIVEYLRRVGETAYSNPEAAARAIEAAAAIDPANAHIRALPAYLDAMRGAVAELGRFRLQPDGADLLDWVQHSRAALQPYHVDIFDDGFLAASRALAAVQRTWAEVGEMLILGRRAPCVERLRHMAEGIQPFNHSVAAWFQQTARLVNDAPEPERFAPNAALADLLLEGFRAWDQGQVGRAADAARRAGQLASSDSERLAIQRLAKLAELSANWLNKGNVADPTLSDETEKAAFDLLLTDEIREYERFAQQMRSEELYLKAMKLGIVTFIKNSSTASYRALFVHYVLRGVLEVQAGHLVAAEFWREAALTTAENWKVHPLFTAFDGELTRRELIARAEDALSRISSFEDVNNARPVLNAPLADQWLKDAQTALTLVLDARNQWADGDFRAARDNLQKALQHLETAAAVMRVDTLQNWLMPYYERAAELSERRRLVEQAAMAGSAEPDPAVLRALEEMVTLSEEAMGTDQARQVRLWRDLYKTMLRTHTNKSLNKRAKLAEFEANFSALFIDKHPAYRLFRRWQDTARTLPEDVEEQLQIDIDTTTEAPIYEDDETAGILDENEEIVPRRPALEARKSSRGWNVVILSAALVLVGVVGFGAWRVLNTPEETPIVQQDTPTRDAILEPVNATASAVAQGLVAVALPTNTPTPRTPTPTLARLASTTPRPATLTPSAIPPSDTVPPPTLTPSLTPTQVITIVTNTPPPLPTNTPAPPTATPLPELAPDIGTRIVVFDILNLIQPVDYDWEPDFFSQGAGGVWQLGASAETAGTAPIAIILSPQFMEAFNPQTSLRLREIDIQMELTLYDETRLENSQVFFGIGLQNARRQRYGAQVVLRQEGVVNLGINENGRFKVISQLPLSPVSVRLSLRRQEDGTIDFLINGQRLGASPNLYPLDEPVSIVLYNAGGGMFVTVSEFNLTLAPFSG